MRCGVQWFQNGVELLGIVFCCCYTVVFGSGCEGVNLCWKSLLMVAKCLVVVPNGISIVPNGLNGFELVSNGSEMALNGSEVAFDWLRSGL